MPSRSDLFLSQAERTTRGHFDLQAHEVEASDALGHGMLDLEPGVHLEEVEGAFGVEQELDRPRVLVACGTRRRDSGRTKGRTRFGGERRTRGLFDDLLMATLEGALALAEVKGLALPVGQDLHLDVTRSFDETLDDHRVVAEGRFRFAPRGREGCREVGLGANDTHAFSAPARDGFKITGQPIPRAAARRLSSCWSSPS
jgi:hypothetical protein